MKLLNFTIIKLSFCFSIGIIIGRYTNIINFNALWIFTVCVSVLVGIYWLALRHKIVKHPYFAILTYVCFVSLGLFSYNLQNEKNNPKHYTHKLTSAITDASELRFTVLERLKPDAYNSKYIVNITTLNSEKTIGKCLVNLKHDSLKKPLNVDAVLFTKAKFVDVQKPLNPNQFDYNAYLKSQDIYKQIYTDYSKLFEISEKQTTIYGHADALRTNINKKLITAGFKPETLSIINALLLGQRQNINATIYSNYVSSGTIHILAVSGLHVGIILWILNFILKPLNLIRHGKLIKPILLVTLLWLFAILAGLSPSVTRAVTMFSIITIAMHLKRPTNIYNTLAISAFLILLVKPKFLFEVGFQMSYLAVLGIVSVQPHLYKLWQPKYWVIDKLWQVFSVTLAAQAGVVPISLFYFHQFPGLFFVANMVIIPILGLILGLGIGVICLALANALPEFLVLLYSYIISILNTFIAWIAQFENFIIKDISYSFLMLIFSYFCIICAIQIYKFKSFKWIALFLVGIIGIQITLFNERYTNTYDAFVVFNKSRYSILGIKHNSKLKVHHNLDSVKLKTDHVINNYSVGNFISTTEIETIQHIYTFKNEHLLVIDSLGVYKNLSFKPQRILLRNSPKLNLNRLIDSLKPKEIIADASNYKSYVARWKATCNAKKIPFHYTNEKGAYILK